MSKVIYIGDENNKARKLKKMYVGISEKLQILDYIESTGTQYIDTGIKPTLNTHYEISVEITEQTTKTDTCLFGARPSGGSNQFLLWDGYNTADVSHRSIPVLGNLVSDYYYQPSSTKNIFKYDGTNFYCNGEKVFEIANTEGTSDFSIFLFALNSNGTADSRMYQGKVFYFKIWQDDVLVRELIPVKDANGVACLFDKVTQKKFYNNGSGQFIAGASQEEITLSSIARKIIKGYIGIANTARPFYSLYNDRYYGTITPLSLARSELANAKTTSYILFAGGASGSTAYANVDTYDANLIKGMATNLQKARKQLAGTYVGECAIFAGGCVTNYTNQMPDADAYNNKLVKQTIGQLNAETLNGAAVNLDDYAFFTGGNEVDSTAYNAKLTRSTPSSLPSKQEGLAGVRIGNYGLFVGGTTGTNATAQVANAVAFNTNLTRSTTTNLTVARVYLSGACTSDYALFAGGATSNWGMSGAVSTVDVYNTNLVRQTPLNLSTARLKLSGVSINGFAVFAGGTTNGNSNTVSSDIIDIFDNNLVRTTTNKLSIARDRLSGAVINNYTIFAGGNPSTDVVDVYNFS